MNNDFIQYFHLLIQYERTYHNFGFVLGPKGNMSSVKRDVSIFIYIYLK